MATGRDQEWKNMEGFDGQLNPNTVYLTLNAGSTLAAMYGTGPIPINGVGAKWSNGGLIIDVPSSTPDTVGPTRYWVNESLIADITQKQPDPIPQGM